MLRLKTYVNRATYKSKYYSAKSLIISPMHLPAGACNTVALPSLVTQPRFTNRQKEVLATKSCVGEPS